MDTPTNPTPEKKPKRPRISDNRNNFGEQDYRRRYNVGDSSLSDNQGTSSTSDSQFSQTGYQRRPYSQNGYQRPSTGYQHPGGYHQRPNPYYNRENNATSSTEQTAEGEENNKPQYNSNSTGYQQRGYKYRQGYNNNNNRQGYTNNRQGYNNNRQGYQQREGGYQQREGGYQQREGGYQQREGGYQQREGGYQQREGGYNQGYNNRQRQGGYNNNRKPGYNNSRDGYNNNNHTRQGANKYGNNNNRNGYNNNRSTGGFTKGKSFTPRPKAVEYEMPIPDPNELVRLNKYMANAGICSRREADEYIQQGLVKVNGEVVTELGTKIKHSDVVEYDEKVVALERKCYILLNKPKDCVTTSDDPNGRTTVMDLVKGACNERIYPVGRLDRNTTGVLLLTNDGDLASKLTHPKYVKKKIYHVWTDHDITEEDMQRIADGVELDDGEIHADAISYATETDRNQAGIEIHSGRNRIVRRIFESLGYHVTKLDRVYFAGLTKKNLPRGRWRYLTQEEVNYLKMGSFE